MLVDTDVKFSRESISLDRRFRFNFLSRRYLSSDFCEMQGKQKYTRI